MRIVFMFLTFVVLLGACKGSQPADTTDVLVSVKGRTLNRSEVNKLIPRGISPQDTEKIRLAAQNADVSICYEDGIQQVYLNGSNVTDRLREEAVGNMASVSSAVREVRARLLDLQRNLAKEADVIMDGRDIGTNILPNADVKIYLTASVKTRADRRYKELTEKGISCSYEEIAEDIKKRDERDMSRETAPLKQAEDAILIDSSDMSIEEVVHAICRQCK